MIIKWKFFYRFRILVSAKVTEAPSEHAAPEFQRVLHSVNANEGETAVLECKVTGEPEPTVKWFKDSEPVAVGGRIQSVSKPDGTQQLVIKNATKEDAGEYRCEATNDGGTAWTEGPLAVKGELNNFYFRFKTIFWQFFSVAGQESAPARDEVAPDFLEPLEAVQVEEGEEVRMQCKVSGTPKPEIHWYKDGQALEESKRIHVENLPDGTQKLTINQAQLDDKGEYRCEAENKAGTTWSDATLGVQMAKTEEISDAGAVLSESMPEFVRELQRVSADEGENVEFECKVEGKPQPDVRWFRDGQEIGPGDAHFELKSEAGGVQKLIIHQVTAEDQGNYKVEATNSAGSMSSKAPLTVNSEFILEKISQISKIIVNLIILD